MHFLCIIFDRKVGYGRAEIHLTKFFKSLICRQFTYQERDLKQCVDLDQDS